MNWYPSLPGRIRSDPRGPGRATIITLFVLPVIAVCGSAPAQGPGQEAAPVVVATLIEREVAAGQTFIGTVLPVRASVVGSAVNGRVVEFLVDEGDPVRMLEEGDPPQPVGQELVKLRTRTIAIQVQAARAELKLREQELAELENGTRPEEIALAKARLTETEVLMKLAKSRRDRTEVLYQQKAAALEEIDEDRSKWQAAEQAYLQARAAHDLAVAGPRQEKIGQAQARRLVQLEEVNRLEDLQAKYTIRAPFAGYVVAQHAEVGQWISEGDPLVEVVELDPAEIRIAVPSSYVAHLHEGMTGRVQIDALPDELLTDELLTATIWRVVPQADLRSRTFPVKLRVANPSGPHGHAFKAGMLAHVTLPVGPPGPALLAPKDALVLDGGTTSVYVVDQNSSVNRVAVTLGVAVDSLIQLKVPADTLNAGDQVVVRGNERLRPGMPVKVVPGGRPK